MYWLSPDKWQDPKFWTQLHLTLVSYIFYYTQTASSTEKLKIEENTLYGPPRNKICFTITDSIQ
jgi:hypothetical protein